MTTWYVVANRAGARILTYARADKTWDLVKTFEHPEGRMMNHELDTDGPGFARMGAQSTKYEPQEDAHTHVARRFAKELATYLDHARMTSTYQRLVLVAEPGFLGMLRDALSKQTAALVVDTVTKDLHHVENRDLDAYISPPL